MKTLNIPLDDTDFELLNEAKGEEISWREFIMTLVTSKRVKAK